MAINLIPQSEDTELLKAGKAANSRAAARTFVDFRSRKAANTLRRYDADLALFAQFLEMGGESARVFERMGFDANSWQYVTWGQVDEFTRWQLANGYAVHTANLRLSTIKIFAKLAQRAGTLDPVEYAMIQSLSPYKPREARNLDDKRRKAGMGTRTGSKKQEPVFLDADQVQALVSQPDSPQGRRDKLLICLGVYRGLRVSEIAILQRGDFDLDAGLIRFYRPKIDEWHTHELDAVTLEAVREYLSQDAPAVGCIWKTSSKGRPSLSGQGMSTRAINKRVTFLGKQAGIENLSPHDLRHTGATMKAQDSTIDELKHWGGWKTYEMAERYLKAREVNSK